MMRSKKRALLRASADAAHLRFAGLRAFASDKADEPKWCQLFPMGTHHNGGWPKAGVTVDKAFCDAMVANWKKIGGPELVVDYFHKTNDESAPNSERVAAGWMQSLEARADGLWALIRWTEKAREHIRADELRCLSPEFALNGVDPHTGKPQGPTLICAGLLTNPAFKEMPRVAAAAVPPATKEAIMNRAQMLALLASASITLPETATDAEVIARLEKHVKEEAALKAKADADAKALKAKAEADADAALKAKQAAEATTASLKAELDAKSTEITKLGVAVAQLQKVNADAGINALLARAKAEGRITAAAAEKGVRELAEKLGLEKAAEFVDSFPKNTVAIVEPMGHGGAGAGAVDVKGLQAKYDAELDALLAEAKKNGTPLTIQAASKQLNKKPEFQPLFAREVINAKPTDALN